MQIFRKMLKGKHLKPAASQFATHTTIFEFGKTQFLLNGGIKMARLPNQHMTAGQPDKPTNLSTRAASEWDRLVAELQNSGIQVSKAHRILISLAATIGADIADAWETVKRDGAYVTNEKTGALQSHPAAKRLDALRRDYIKVMSLIGLRAAVAGDVPGNSLEDFLNS